MTKVAIFGGGVAGLSAAQELRHRGFDVDVYEASDWLGGKASSQTVDAMPPAPVGSKELLGEHGFRFFPGFYFNIIATMSEIPRPAADGGGSVADDLRASRTAAMAYPPDAGKPRFFPFDRQLSLPPWDVYGRLRAMLAGLNFTNVDLARMAWFRLKYLTSGPTRRTTEWDAVSWYDFVELDSPHYSPSFKEFEESIPRTMSAMAAKTTSAMIVGNIGMQFGLSYARPGTSEDRLLAGPTTHRWLQPWEDYLRKLGVGIKKRHQLVALDYPHKSLHVAGATILDDFAVLQKVVADYYIVALPLEEMRRQLAAAPALQLDDPELAALVGINPANATAWMAGVQFFLKSDVPMVDGHVFYPQSDWALTSVSQGQFWTPNGQPMEKAYGDGTARGVLSVIVSDWMKKSSATGLAASEYTAAQKDALLNEVRRQLQSSLPGTFDLSDANMAHKPHLDRSIVWSGPNQPPDNSSLLLIHPLKGYGERPRAHNKIDNLFLAADYVRTSVGLATMEGANEAARLAVNALLDEAGGQQVRCPIWTLQEDPFFAPAKQLDELRRKRGLPHVMESCPIRYLNDVGLIDWMQEVFKLPLGELWPG